MRDNCKNEIKMILSGTFYQYCGPLDDAFNELINISSDEWLLLMLEYFKEFLETNELTTEEKEEFIENNVDIYIPLTELTPLDWFKHLTTMLESERFKRKIQ